MRRDPFQELNTLRRGADRLLDSSLVGFPRGTSPALDMYETDKEIVISAAVPGVDPNDLQITVVGDTVQIKGEVKAEEEKKERDFFFRERSYGAFSRTLALPGYVEPDKAVAEFENGVLKLSIPKAKAHQPKVIQVTSK
jgi:HSP20 family protein